MSGSARQTIGARLKAKLHEESHQCAAHIGARLSVGARLKASLEATSITDDHPNGAGDELAPPLRIALVTSSNQCDVGSVTRKLGSDRLSDAT